MIPLQPSSMWNTTYQSDMVVTNTVSGGSLLFLVVILFGTILLVTIISSIEKYTKFWMALEWLWKSVKYTVYGLGITVVGAALYIVCSLLALAGSGISLQHILLAIGGYVGVTLLGWVASKVYARTVSLHVKYKSGETVEKGGV